MSRYEVAAIGADRFAALRGEFWGHLETRPYMRARLGLAQALRDLGRVDEAVAHYRALLELNPGDNQGVRYVLLATLLQRGMNDEAGALLSEHDCRRLLKKHVGSEIAFSKSLLAPATRTQIVVRMLLNLKRIYVHMRSFPQARDVTELLLAVTPSALSELRDRGLLAYHLNDVTGALRDLQTYLKLSSLGEMDKEAREEHQQIWEHVKTLRRRVAALN